MVIADDSSKNQIKTMIVEAMIKMGFSEIIPLKERLYQLQIVENTWMIIWGLFSLSLFFISPKYFLLWLGAAISCLAIEQLVALPFHWVRHLVYGKKEPFLHSLYFQQSIRRPLYHRLNFLFFVFFAVSQIVLMARILSDLGLYLTWFWLPQIVFMTWTAVDLSYNKMDKTSDPPQARWISMGLALRRGGREISSIIRKGVGFAIPGIALAFIVGAMSQELWQIINKLSWINLGLVSLIIVLYILISGSSAVRTRIKEKIDELDLENSVLSTDERFLAINRYLAFSNPKASEQEVFNNIDKERSWKWQKPIKRWAKNDLIKELQKRSLWHLWISYFFILPILFIIMVLISALLFPSGVLNQWLNGQSVYKVSDLITFLFAAADPISAQKLWGLVFQDPRLKFSVISAFLLAAYFVANYVLDRNQVFSNLELEVKKLKEWFSIIYSYYKLNDLDYQEVLPFSKRIGGPFSNRFISGSILIVPDFADRNLINQVIAQVENFLSPLPTIDFCILIGRLDDFFGSSLALKYYPEEWNPKPETPEIQSTKAQCWLWVHRRNLSRDLYYYKSFDDAYADYKSKALKKA